MDHKETREAVETKALKEKPVPMEKREMLVHQDPEDRRVSLEIGEKTETFLLLSIPKPVDRLKNSLFGSILSAKC